MKGHWSGELPFHRSINDHTFHRILNNDLQGSTERFVLERINRVVGTTALTDCHMLQKKTPVESYDMYADHHMRAFLAKKAFVEVGS
jgi:hypothetical protein